MWKLASTFSQLRYGDEPLHGGKWHQHLNNWKLLALWPIFVNNFHVESWYPDQNFLWLYLDFTCFLPKSRLVLCISLPPQLYHFYNISVSDAKPSWKLHFQSSILTNKHLLVFESTWTNPIMMIKWEKTKIPKNCLSMMLQTSNHAWSSWGYQHIRLHCLFRKYFLQIMFEAILLWYT